jgi:hypothetical protein
VMGLYGGAFISVHLLLQSPGCISAVSGGDLHRQAVAPAMQMLRGYTAQGRRTSSARSGLVEGTMVWTMPAENSAELVEELSSHGASEAAHGSGVGSELRDHLRKTDVERAALCGSDRKWRRTESVLTRVKGEDGVTRGVKLCGQRLASLQRGDIALWRNEHCRAVLGLPPLDFLCGSPTGSSQLLLHEALLERKH